MRINTVAVYWRVRRESAESCTNRLARYLLSLRHEFPTLMEWHRKAGATSTAIMFDENEHGQLLDIIRAGTNKRDIGGSAIPELGFRVGLWNKRKDPEIVGLGITCGLYSNASGLTNAVTLSLPKDLAALSLHESGTLRKLLLLQVEAWDPEWGAVFSSQGDAIKSRSGSSPFLDKMLWLKDGENLSKHVDGSCSKEAVLGGTLCLR